MVCLATQTLVYKSQELFLQLLQRSVYLLNLSTPLCSVNSWFVRNHTNKPEENKFRGTSLLNSSKSCQIWYLMHFGAKHLSQYLLFVWFLVHKLEAVVVGYLMTLSSQNKGSHISRMVFLALIIFSTQHASQNQVTMNTKVTLYVELPGMACPPGVFEPSL